MSEFVKAVRSIMSAIERRVFLMVGRGTFSRLSRSEGMHQAQITGLDGETIETDRPQPFGFKSSPVEGDAIFMCVGGSRDHALVIMVDDRSCPVSLGAGEVCIYNAEGDYAHFKAAGEIEVSAAQKVTVKAPLEVYLDTPLLRVKGNIIDQCDSGGQSMAAMRATYNSHTHRENDNGQNTNAPNQTMGGA